MSTVSALTYSLASSDLFKIPQPAAGGFSASAPEAGFVGGINAALDVPSARSTRSAH